MYFVEILCISDIKLCRKKIKKTLFFGYKNVIKMSLVLRIHIHKQYTQLNNFQRGRKISFFVSVCPRKVRDLV